MINVYERATESFWTKPHKPKAKPKFVKIMFPFELCFLVFLQPASPSRNVLQWCENGVRQRIKGKQINKILKVHGPPTMCNQDHVKNKCCAFSPLAVYEMPYQMCATDEHGAKRLSACYGL